MFGADFSVMFIDEFLSDPFRRFAISALITTNLASAYGASRWICVALAGAGLLAVARCLIVNEVEARRKGLPPFWYLFDDDQMF